MEAGATQHFWMHFYSAEVTAGSSNTKMVFRNAMDYSNQYVKNFYGVSSLASVEQLTTNSLKLYPNPVNSYLTIETNFESEELIVLNNLGQEVLRQEFSSTLDVSHLASGIYQMKLVGNSAVLIEPFIVEQLLGTILTKTARMP